jgi:flavin reductase (DIM6/NTAB) family NADH-FMN oxidoreductase RutF
MSFALVTTVHENGETGIGPHALCFPFGITKPYSMLLISRNNSGTATNIRRNRKCALNYILFDREDLKSITSLGVPGMPLEDKTKANPYTLIDSPTPERAVDPDFPKIVAEAFQVIECTWEDTFDLHSKSDDFERPYDGHFTLGFDHILMKERYAPGVEAGDIFPNMPVFQGYRANRLFWFAKHQKPFSIPLPKVKGMEFMTVHYMANRIDANVVVTEEACKKLTGIPEPFMKEALQGIIDRAIEDGVSEIDERYLEKINAER